MKKCLYASLISKAIKSKEATMCEMDKMIVLQFSLVFDFIVAFSSTPKQGWQPQKRHFQENGLNLVSFPTILAINAMVFQVCGGG